MARKWDIFHHGPRLPRSEQIHVTINRRGIFYLNRRAYQELGSPPAALLMFEKDTDIIGIAPAHPHKQGAFPFRKGPPSSSWIIFGSPFCQQHGIRVDGTEAFFDPEIDSDGILNLNLRTTRRVYGGKKSRKKKEE